MNLVEFNSAPSDIIRRQLEACVSIPTFASAVLNQRPYQTRAELFETAEVHTGTWTPDEVAMALRDEFDPRIEDKKYLAAKSLTRLQRLVNADL